MRSSRAPVERPSLSARASRGREAPRCHGLRPGVAYMHAAVPPSVEVL